MNNIFPNKETVTLVREMYPPGCRVALVSIDDPYTRLQPGDCGSVDHVDDTGTVFVAWDSGSRQKTSRKFQTARSMARILLNGCNPR